MVIGGFPAIDVEFVIPRRGDVDDGGSGGLLQFHVAAEPDVLFDRRIRMMDPRTLPVIRIHEPHGETRRLAPR